MSQQPPPKYDEKSLAEPAESETLEEVIVIEEAPRLSRDERAIREQIEISGVSDQRREEAPRLSINKRAIREQIESSGMLNQRMINNDSMCAFNECKRFVLEYLIYIIFGFIMLIIKAFQG